MKSGSHPVRVRTNRGLADALGVSEAAVRKARREGRLSDPGPNGWDVAAARREWATKTLPHVGGARRKARGTGGRRGSASSHMSWDAVAAGETEARHVLRKPAGDVLTLADARRARELVKLAREALELRRVSEDTFSKAELDRYVFRIFRGVRDWLDGAVSREAPLVAARLGVEEGAMWRELRGFMRQCQEGLADVGARKLTRIPTETADETNREARQVTS